MKYVPLENIIFTGKQNIQWKAVEQYLKRFVGMSFMVNEYKDKLHVSASFADEYAESRYTKSLRGGLAKVKANLSQIVPQLIENATNRRWIENKSAKHVNNAGKGWYRYDAYFSIPIQAENEEKIRHNYYTATLVVRINDQGLYLHDIINIKKEARKPRES